MMQSTLDELLNYVEMATFVVAILAAVLGLYIGYQAYRGLRRNDSPAMRYLATGMILLFGVTYATAFLGQALISVRILPIQVQDFFRLLVRVLQVAGLATIAYSLRLASRESPSTDATETDVGQAGGAENVDD